MRSNSPLSLLLCITILLLSLCTQIPIVSAQFAFFDQLFNQQGQHQQQQQQRGGSTGASSQWSIYADSVQCTQYLCPTTLACVTNPIDCPCPTVEDTRCVIPDSDSSSHTHSSNSGTVLCVRGGEDCAEVKKLSRKLV